MTKPIGATEAYFGNADTYCEEHARHGWPSSDCEEVDSPLHCCVCHRPLMYRLTPDGVDYVVESLAEEILSDEKMEKHAAYKGTWYEGEPHMSILFDWWEVASDYYDNMRPIQKVVMDTFYNLYRESTDVSPPGDEFS